MFLDVAVIVLYYIYNCVTALHYYIITRYIMRYNIASTMTLFYYKITYIPYSVPHTAE